MCRWVVRIFAMLYAFALVLLIIGTFGMLGQERDPLAGVFLIPLGFPWIYILDRLGPLVIAATPLVNLGLLAAPCALMARFTQNSSGS